MEHFLNSVESALLILMMMAAGYFCSAKGWLGQREKQFLTRLLMNLAIPCMCVNSLLTHTDRAMLQGAWPILLVSLCSTGSCCLLGLLTGRLLKLPRRSLGVFTVLAGLSNSLFIGYPVCVGIYGEAATPYVMLNYLVASFFTQCVAQAITMWAGGKAEISPRLLLNLLRQPTLWGMLAGIAMALAGVRLPGLIMKFTGYMANTVTPLALIVTGQVLYQIGFKDLRPDRTLLAVLLFRFLISPSVNLLFSSLFGIRGLAAKVLMCIAAMPCISQATIMAANYQADEELACRGNSLTTLVSLLTIPFISVIAEALL